MRLISLIAILSFTILVSPIAAAAQNQIAPPFTKLFRPPSSPLLNKPAAPTVPFDSQSITKSPLLSRLSPKVVCGMTVVPVDSSIDPKIVRPVPSDGTKFTLRIHKPPVCGQ